MQKRGLLVVLSAYVNHTLCFRKMSLFHVFCVRKCVPWGFFLGSVKEFPLWHHWVSLSTFRHWDTSLGLDLDSFRTEKCGKVPKSVKMCKLLKCVIKTVSAPTRNPLNFLTRTRKLTILSHFMTFSWKLTTGLPPLVLRHTRQMATRTGTTRYPPGPAPHYPGTHHPTAGHVSVTAVTVTAFRTVRQASFGF